VVEKAINTKFIPTIAMETMKGSNKSSFFVNRIPILEIDELRINNEVEDKANYFFDSESGEVILNGNGTHRFSRHDDIGIKYKFGYLAKGDAHYVDGFSGVGNNVIASVQDASEYVVGNYYELVSLDGNQELIKIVSIDETSNEIEIDNLSRDYEPSDIILYELVVPGYVKRLIEIEATTYAGLNAIGSTYTFNTNYSLGDLNVAKGVPYTHWAKTLDKCLQERKELKEMIKIKYVVR